MRIITGMYKAKRLAKVRGDIRPTPEKLRESLFSILGDDVRESIWLDLFSGSGVIGIEALSRGSGHVIFNDRDRDAHKLILENLKRCGATRGYELCDLDAFVLLRNPKRLVSQIQVDYIFMDPSYQFGRYQKLLSKTVVSPLFSNRKTLVMLEVFRKTKVDFIPPELKLIRTITCGDSHLLLFKSLL